MCGLKPSAAVTGSSGYVTPCVGVWIETVPLHRTRIKFRHTLRGCVDWNGKEEGYRVNCQSHPAWVCGLKQGTLEECQAYIESHPAWVCGLKPVGDFREHAAVQSHPAWVCGLKPSVTSAQNTCAESHPAWVCGLKHRYCTQHIGWWMSHPAWVCGLKLDGVRQFGNGVRSHPAWVCGLKHNVSAMVSSAASHTLRGCVDWNSILITFLPRGLVTPCVGVWIETGWRKYDRSPHTRHTLRGCVDWNSSRSTVHLPRSSHTLRGCVDWNYGGYLWSGGILCHTLRGCVDWNLNPGLIPSDKVVTPCVGVWIETFILVSEIWTTRSHPAWVCGLKLFVYGKINIIVSHTLRGCVDWNM